MKMCSECLLYIASCEIDPQKPTGIQKKIFNQISVLKAQGNFDVILVGFYKKGIIVFNDNTYKVISGKDKRKLRNDFCKQVCAKKSISKCYIRNSICDPSFNALLKALKKKNVFIIIEIPTYPYDEELKDSIKHRLVLCLDKIYRPSMHKFVDRIVTYSDDKTIYGIECINIYNGINVFDNKISDRKKANSELHFIGVAKVCDWHGYDRLITGIKDYYNKNDTDEKVYFHVVGDGPALDHCKHLTDHLGVGQNVVFHGFKAGTELDEIYEIADVGVDCLGLHRKKMTHVSSLKSREYASRGLPILCANHLDAIPDDWKYLHMASADNSPVDVLGVVEWFSKLTSECDDYKSDIRSFAEENFDISKTFLPVLLCYGETNDE